MVATPVRERLFTVHEFRRMAEAGVFAPDEFVELLAGHIVVMPPQGPRHAGTVHRLMRLLLAAGVLIDGLFVERPILLNSETEVVPDLSLITPDPADPGFRRAHPAVSQVLLAIEVSDSTVAFDLGEKAEAYARSGLQEYWVIDLQSSRIVRYRQPSSKAYQQNSVHVSGSLTLPGNQSLDVGAIFAN